MAVNLAIMYGGVWSTSNWTQQLNISAENVIPCVVESRDIGPRPEQLLMILRT